MSIHVCGRIKEKCINDTLLEQVINDFFLNKIEFDKKNDKKYITYEALTGNNSFSILFMDEKKPPNNVYDSSIINDDFSFVQLVIFDVNKECATFDMYVTIIKFCKYLKSKIKSDILITSDVHDEICLLRDDSIIWAHNSLFKGDMIE